MASSRALFLVFAAVLLVNEITVAAGRTKRTNKTTTKTWNINLGGKGPSKPAQGNNPASGETADTEPAEGQGNPLGASQIWGNMVSGYSLQLTQADAPEPSPALDCHWLCKDRCKDYSEKGQCMSACQLCCNRCQCVPPGTSGNKEKCGKCYDEQTVVYGYKITCP